MILGNFPQIKSRVFCVAEPRKESNPRFPQAHVLREPARRGLSECPAGQPPPLPFNPGPADRPPLQLQPVLHRLDGHPQLLIKGRRFYIVGVAGQLQVGAAPPGPSAAGIPAAAAPDPGGGVLLRRTAAPGSLRLWAPARARPSAGRTRCHRPEALPPRRTYSRSSSTSARKAAWEMGNSVLRKISGCQAT